MRRGLRGVCRPADSSPRPPGPRLGTEVAPLRGCPGSRSLLPAKALCTLLGPPSPNLPEAPQAPASGHVAGLPPPWDVPPSLLLLEMRRGQGKPPPTPTQQSKGDAVSHPEPRPSGPRTTFPRPASLHGASRCDGEGSGQRDSVGGLFGAKGCQRSLRRLKAFRGARAPLRGQLPPLLLLKIAASESSSNSFHAQKSSHYHSVVFTSNRVSMSTKSIPSYILFSLNFPNLMLLPWSIFLKLKHCIK